MIGKKSLVIDLDDTLCFPKHQYHDSIEKYGNALPNLEVINKLNALYDSGIYIIIHSARRMVTHSGDLDKILEDIHDITTEWLDKYNVKYNELIFGKPYSSTYYVDDKAMNIDEFLAWTIDEV